MSFNEQIVQQQAVSPTKETDSQKSSTTGTGTETPAAKPSAEGQPNEKKSFDAQKFAAIARREKAALEAERRAKAEFEKSSSLSEKLKSYEDKKAEARKAPFKFLEEELGLTYEDLTQMMLNDGKPTDNMELKDVRSELQKFKDEMAQRVEKEKEEALTSKQREEQEAQQKQIDDFKAGIPEKLAKIEKIDLVNALLDPSEQGEEIFKIIEEHWLGEEDKVSKDPNHNPTMLSVEEAADILEEVLSEQFTSKVSKSKKYGALLQQMKSGTAPKKDTPNKEESMFGSKTLTNDTATSPSLLSPAAEADRMKRALSALGGS